MTPTFLSILVLQAYPTFQGGNPDAARRSIYRWMKHAQLAVRRITHKASTDEAAMGEQVLEAAESFRGRRALEDIPLSMCINMDETALDLRESFRSTIARRGERSVAVRAPKGCPKRVTVLLAVGFGGEFLRPLVVFEAKRGGAVEREMAPLDGVCLHTVQAKGWCDQDVMDKWVAEVLNPHGEAQRGAGTSAALLMMDNYSVHTTGNTYAGLDRGGVHAFMLPPNTTSMSQPLDVGLNKPFKDRVATKLLEYLLVPGNEELPVSRRLLSSWIGEVWSEMEGTIDVERTLCRIGYVDRPEQ